MPVVDMPLEQLRVYQGKNPRPADFDEFWDKSLAEMNAIDPQAEFTPYPYASKIADCFELRFRSTKNAVIYAKFTRPKKIDGKIPAILHFHGLSGDSGSWKSLIAFASQGCCSVSLDCRGQGGLSQDVGGVNGTTYTTPFTRGLDGTPEDLLCRDLFLDTAMLARIVMGLDYVDENRVGVYGGSQGGALSIACAALVPEIKRREKMANDEIQILVQNLLAHYEEWKAQELENIRGIYEANRKKSLFNPKKLKFPTPGEIASAKIDFIVMMSCLSNKSISLLGLLVEDTNPQPELINSSGSSSSTINVGMSSPHFANSNLYNGLISKP